VQTARQALGALFLGLALLVLVGGMLVLIFVQSNQFSAPVLAPTVQPTQTVAPATVIVPIVTDVFVPEIPTVEIVPFTPIPAVCPPPEGWIAINILEGDSLSSLSARYGVTVAQLQQRNCLTSDVALLPPGTIFYVPAGATRTPQACGAPFGWIRYTVQPGDTLFHLSWLYNTTIAELQRANCLGTSQLIRAGEVLFVPNVATRTVTATVTATMTASATNTETPAPSATDTETAIPSNTPEAPTIAPSNTPAPSATP
jgi:LysM repeat protein